MTHPLFGEWLMRTQILQRTSYGVDPAKFDPEERAGYFREMGFAAMVELAEMSNEIGWKSWGTDRSLNKESYLKEGVDVLHFIANLLVVGGITDQELNDAYNAKMEVNQKRMASGAYDGRIEGKCPRCRRSYDDVHQVEGKDHCATCEVADSLQRRTSDG